MALVLKEGLIVNVAMLVPPVDGPAHAFASVVKAAMTAMTRAQAEEWAGKAIRFNAIAPQTVQDSAPAQPRRASRRSRHSRCTWPRAAARRCRGSSSRPSRRGSPRYVL
jgi:NAD(P)-dependent dehydrogenase (short-subunit alcohol dehydrogenase family)